MNYCEDWKTGRENCWNPTLLRALLASHGPEIIQCSLRSKWLQPFVNSNDFDCTGEAGMHFVVQNNCLRCCANTMLHARPGVHVTSTIFLPSVAGFSLLLCMHLLRCIMPQTREKPPNPFGENRNIDRILPKEACWILPGYDTCE